MRVQRVFFKADSRCTRFLLSSPPGYGKGQIMLAAARDAENQCQLLPQSIFFLVVSLSGLVVVVERRGTSII